MDWERSGPECSTTLVETARDEGTFETLVKALKLTGLDRRLGEKGPYTMFAPHDRAFSRLPERELRELMRDKEELARVLSRHIVEGKHMLADLVRKRYVVTLSGMEMRIQAGTVVKVAGVAIIQPDIICENGVLHIIESVLMNVP